ncbi:MAG: hypothetical protein ACI3ZY_05635 [Parabacteroides sp.]
MKITVVQTNKELANGEYLICVRVFCNGKYKHYTTKVSCTKSNWNSKTATVSSKDRRYKEKNAAIQMKLAEVEKMYHLNDTADKAEKELRQKQTETTFYDVIRAKMDDCYSRNTAKNHKQLYNYLQAKYPILTVSMITKEWFAQFVATLQAEKTVLRVNQLVKLFFQSYRFGWEHGLIKDYVALKYKPQKVAPKERYLSNTELNTVLTLYYDSCQYYDLMAEINREHEAVFLFVLHLAFQGIAPVDMAKLKVKDLEFEDVEVESTNLFFERTKYVDNKTARTRRLINIKLFRQKSREYVNVITYCDTIKDIIEYFTKGKSDDDYLINCLDSKKTYTEEKRSERVGNYYNKMTKHLNAYYKRTCVKYGLQSKHITYYMARHTLINKLYYMNVSENIIKRLVGHKDSTLQQYYVADVTKIQQAEIVSKVFEGFKYVTSYNLGD